MKREMLWVKKAGEKVYAQALLEANIKFNKVDGCDNIHQCKKSVEEKFRDSSPVFFISTGRTGTQFFEKLTKKASRVRSYHEPFPTLMSISREMFQAELGPKEQKLIFGAARYEFMLKHFMAGFQYVESNQTLISLIEGILEFFPNAKIVCVARDPFKFSSSAYRKGWFENDTIWENNRILRKDTSENNSLMLIFNYWVDVNRKLLSMAKSHPRNCKIYRMEDVVSDVNCVKEMMNFAGIKINDLREIENIMKVKVNENVFNKWDHGSMFKKVDVPDVEDFLNDNKLFYEEELLPLMEELGYAV